MCGTLKETKRRSDGSDAPPGPSTRSRRPARRTKSPGAIPRLSHERPRPRGGAPAGGVSGNASRRLDGPAGLAAAPTPRGTRRELTSSRLPPASSPERRGGETRRGGRGISSRRRPGRTHPRRVERAPPRGAPIRGDDADGRAMHHPPPRPARDVPDDPTPDLRRDRMKDARGPCRRRVRSSSSAARPVRSTGAPRRISSGVSRLVARLARRRSRDVVARRPPRAHGARAARSPPPARVRRGRCRPRPRVVPGGGDRARHARLLRVVGGWSSDTASFVRCSFASRAPETRNRHLHAPRRDRHALTPFPGLLVLRARSSSVTAGSRPACASLAPRVSAAGASSPRATSPRTNAWSSSPRRSSSRTTTSAAPSAASSSPRTQSTPSASARPQTPAWLLALIAEVPAEMWAARLGLALLAESRGGRPVGYRRTPAPPRDALHAHLLHARGVRAMHYPPGRAARTEGHRFPVEFADGPLRAAHERTLAAREDFRGRGGRGGGEGSSRRRRPLSRVPFSV